MNMSLLNIHSKSCRPGCFHLRTHSLNSFTTNLSAQLLIFVFLHADFMNLSFAGCGFLGVYHLGVAACLSSHAPQFLKNVTAFAGASAGSLVAAVLATSAPLNKCSDYVIDLTHDARRHPLGPFNPQFDLVGNLRRGLELHLPSNTHRVCSGRLFVSVTSLKDRKNVIISEFDSKEELIQVWKKLFITPKFLTKNDMIFT